MKHLISGFVLIFAGGGTWEGRVSTGRLWLLGGLGAEWCVAWRGGKHALRQAPMDNYRKFSDPGL